MANSPLYRGRNPIDNLQMAVARLGTRLVRSLVVSLIMQQIFQATNDLLDKRFRQIWEQSVQMAAISRVLAQSLPTSGQGAGPAGRIDPQYRRPAGSDHGGEVSGTARRSARAGPGDRGLSPRIGQRILQEWDFPESLIRVPANFLDLHYDRRSTG